MTRICDLPHDLVDENILTKVPITSLKAVRSTCKLWNDLSYELIVGKATTKHHEFLGFLTMWSKFWSVRFDLQGIRNDDDEDLVKPSIKQVKLLNQVEISTVLHCNGLLLCVLKNNSNLVVWNPYLRQKRWIRPRKHFNPFDGYALGYDNNRNHKILRLSDAYAIRVNEMEIYDFSSDSWRVLDGVLDVTRDFEINGYRPCVTLKGNTYLFAEVRREGPLWPEDFFICFDFTRERFGQFLPLPFNSDTYEPLTYHVLGEEQLVMLCRKPEAFNLDIFEISVTNKIEPNSVSSSKLFMTPFTDFMFDCEARSFFIDEEKKLAVVFICNTNDSYSEKYREPVAYIIGEDGYIKSVSLEQTQGLRLPRMFSFPCVSFSYLPNLVQIKQPRKRNDRDA